MGEGAPGPLAAASAPRAGPVYQNVSNLAFSVTGGSATFTNNSLIISDVSPAVSFFTTVPYWRGGAPATACAFVNLLVSDTCVSSCDESVRVCLVQAVQCDVLCMPRGSRLQAG